MATSKILSNADYVVEQGTSGFWTYRKWNSGFCEAWGEHNVTGKTGQSWAAGLYYSDEPFTLPSGLFVSTPYPQATSYTSQWTVYAVWVNTTNGTIRITKPNSQSQPASVSLYIRGRWK